MAERVASRRPNRFAYRPHLAPRCQPSASSTDIRAPAPGWGWGWQAEPGTHIFYSAAPQAAVVDRPDGDAGSDLASDAVGQSCGRGDNGRTVESLIPACVVSEVATLRPRRNYMVSASAVAMAAAAAEQSVRGENFGSGAAPRTSPWKYVNSVSMMPPSQRGGRCDASPHAMAPSIPFLPRSSDCLRSWSSSRER